MYFPSYVRQKGYKQQKWPSRSLKVTDNGAIQQDTYDFLLVFHCNYVSPVPFLRYCHLFPKI